MSRAGVEEAVLAGRTKARVHKAQCSRGAGEPSHRALRAPSRRRDAASGATSTYGQPQRPQVPAVAREPPGGLLLMHLEQA